jgi:hypothetical protein
MLPDSSAGATNGSEANAKMVKLKIAGRTDDRKKRAFIKPPNGISRNSPHNPLSFEREGKPEGRGELKVTSMHANLSELHQFLIYALVLVSEFYKRGVLGPG